MRPLRITLTALYFLTCCLLFVLPGNAFPKENFLDTIQFDKWVHVGMFGLLALLVCWTFESVPPPLLWRIFWALLAYGVLVEIVQGLWVANRAADVWDALADAAGAAAGLLLWRRCSREAS